jgi:hypothetical protein
MRTRPFRVAPTPTTAGLQAPPQVTLQDRNARLTDDAKARDEAMGVARGQQAALEQARAARLRGAGCGRAAGQRVGCSG